MNAFLELLLLYPISFSMLYFHFPLSQSTVVPLYLMLIHSGTRDECQIRQILKDEAFSLVEQRHDSYKF